MLVKRACGSSLGALALAALAVVPSGAARADSPPVLSPLEQNNFVVVDWTSPDSYDYYTVNYTIDGNNAQETPPTGAGTGGERLLPLPPLKSTIVVCVRGWRYVDGVPHPGPYSSPQSLRIVMMPGPWTIH